MWKRGEGRGAGREGRGARREGRREKGGWEERYIGEEGGLCMSW